MNKCAELFFKKINGEITPEQLDLELAGSTFLPDTWKEASCVLMPPPVPEKLSEFYKLDSGTKAKINVPLYFAQFSEYFRSCAEIRSKNYSRLDWLKKVKQIIPAGDLTHHRMLDEAIRRFNLALEAGPFVITRPVQIYAKSGLRNYE